MPDLTLSSHWLVLMLDFVLIDSCEYFGFGFSKVRFRVSWFFDDYSKTSLSKINCNSNIHSFWEKKWRNPRKLNWVLYNYTHFSYFFVCLFFLQGLINLKNYDDRLYVNVDDLAVWASDFSYRKGWSNEYWSPMTSSSIFLIYFTFGHNFCY